MEAEALFMPIFPADLKFQMIPPAKSNFQNATLRLLLSAAYDLVNSHSKSQRKSNEVFYLLELNAMVWFLNHLLLALLAVENVHDDLLTRIDVAMQHLITNLNKKLKLEEVVHGPETQRILE